MCCIQCNDNLQNPLKGINKSGVEAFYDYIKSELKKHKNGIMVANNANTNNWF